MNFRYALRQLRKNPAFTLTAALTLAIGIGATTAIFSLVYAVLLRPLPFPQADQLVWLNQQDHSLPGVVAESLSYPDYFDWRAQNHTLSGIASYRGGNFTFFSNGETQHLESQVVSANFFQVLGVAPMLGRDFRWDEEKPGNRAVMLSYGLWQSAFGSANDIVGRSIRLGDDDYSVAGVMPKGFQFPFATPAPQLWVSIATDAYDPTGNDPATAQRGNDSLGIIGRLKPGVTLQQAKADLGVIANNLAKQYPDSNKWYTSALVKPELDHLTGDTRPALRVLFGAVALVLLIACANVAGLLLARGSQRSAEFALRTAIGASRGEIIRQMLSESVILSLCGGISGIVLAGGLLKATVSLLPVEIPRIEQVSVNGTVLAFAVVVSILTGILFGLLPAWRMSQVEPSSALRDGARNVSSGHARHTLQSGLVIAQTAIGLVLLVASGLLIRSFIRVMHVDPGFDSKHVLTTRLGVSFDHRYNHDQHYQFYEQVLAKLAAQPGVKGVSAGWPLPFSNSYASVSLAIEGRPVAKGDEPSEAFGAVMPGYFETMRIPILSGRTFTGQDGFKSTPVIIINQALAAKYFPGENPIGKHIRAELGDGVLEHPMREVVGVVGNTKQLGLKTDAAPMYYLPYAQAVITNPYLVIRSNSDPAQLANTVRRVVSQMDSEVPVYQVSMLEDYVSKSAAQPRFQTWLLGCFAGVALLLSAVGLYGLLSYVVVQRTFEIGLRMAIGAQRSDMLKMILRRGLRLAAIGLGIGLAASMLLTRFLAHMLYGVTPLDLLTFATVSIVLMAVAAAASFAPAWRASRLDPMQTLRNQ
ncbi:ABC transporter permease [Alloacidobacterium dinghuense]|uniref:ABC transporter permease n=1 Tax=Alloacidobacterium dinghuense TaxID=2763107 RepID=A0A7G8BNE7_9BACT|nr:ABC transporter permease [Alloacidobacterium dinghuense]QNI34067.1 ABC transporter permease [Alloacidobacterium dinghuense]